MRPAYVVLLAIFLYSVHAKSRVKRIIGGVPADLPPILSLINNTRPGLVTPAPPTPTESLVFIRRDKRSATINGIKNEDGTYSFLGLRYAEAPVRRFRFQRPRRLKLRGDINATKFGPPCAQWRWGRVFGSEDCLYLNVYTPQVPTSNTTPAPTNPVLVWIHGGNFKTGSSAQYVPRDLVKKGIVVVTIQYRLGSLGFLSLGRKELPGNTGLFDISMAMRWVYDYIRFFGGDPNRVTPGGQGSGASCATMLALNRHARKRLNGVLAMSGSPISPFSLDENERRTSREVSKETGMCDGLEGVQFVRCMQKLPLETILKADSGVQEKRVESNSFPKGLANLLVPGPAEEGKEDERFLPHFMVQSPLDAIQKGLFPSIPLLTGVTNEETGGGCRGTFLEEIQNKLLSPNFLQSDIFTGALFANNGLFVNKTVNEQLTSLFANGDYLKFFTSLITTAVSDLDKVIKHTTDAFFNLPAFITSHLWSKKNNVFLYSFDHTPQKSLAGEFLSGMPLAGSSSQNNKKGAGHGDDLMYLFDIRSLEGNPFDNVLTNVGDLKVREHFCNMVAEFIKSGKPRINGVQDWQPFTAKDGKYMIINEQPRLGENFHKCEMGMWTGDNGILGSSDCSFLNQAVDVVKNTVGNAGSTLLNTADGLAGTLGVNNLRGQLTSLTNPLDDRLGGVVGGGNGGDNKPLGSLLGLDNTRNGGSAGGSTTSARPSTTRRPSGGLLGLGGGGGLLG